MTFSVVTLSKLAENLNAFVDALLRCEPSLPKHRIIVVNDGARQSAARHCMDLTWLDGMQPFIFARNANIGLRHAFEYQQADFAVLMNDDALLISRNGLSHLTAAHARHPNYGILSAATNLIGNENQIRRSDAPAGIIRREPRMLCFVCVSISRACWQAVGELDERFIGYGFDDDDYSRRALKAGFRLGVLDACYVDHAALHSTFRGDPRNSGPLEQNRRIFLEKWRMQV